MTIDNHEKHCTPSSIGEPRGCTANRYGCLPEIGDPASIRAHRPGLNMPDGSMRSIMTWSTQTRAPETV